MCCNTVPTPCASVSNQRVSVKLPHPSARRCEILHIQPVSPLAPSLFHSLSLFLSHLSILFVATRELGRVLYNIMIRNALYVLCTVLFQFDQLIISNKLREIHTREHFVPLNLYSFRRCCLLRLPLKDQ